MAIFNHAPGPEDGQNSGKERKPAHKAVLQGITVSSALEAADEGIQGEGGEQNGHDDQHGEDELAHVVPQQGKQSQRDDDS